MPHARPGGGTLGTPDNEAVSRQVRTVLSPTPATTARRVFAVLRLAAGVLVLVALITQIVNQLLYDEFEPDRYFSLFTIQTSMINVVVLLFAGVSALRRNVDTELLTSLRVCTVAYATVTFLVYNVLLRGAPNTDFPELQWPGELMHVWVPIYILVEWIVAPGRPAVPWRRLGLAIAYPLLWLAFTLVHGAATSWYPYPFLEPDGPDGSLGVAVYVVVLFSFILFMAAVATAISRIGSRRRERRG
jgi:lysylphosphatidylglycerol synthetase-like protein (DUF2156 family)